ncbi:hypothetical protein GCM10011391_26960 [Pullulanibacillus camelliae]|uniref:Prepilin-type N-terminal cleavage/methylation domain-containing protein n=2 Tax=Pullulanibacillus camelliae TaxID=1707096 RepID=A0A8J2YJN1_9BACL|nr:hypothetical protein GCM10011391_26960 [Pullulanibacillus camelliae]
MHKQAGYTLIEVMIVMSIMLSVFPLIFMKISDIREHEVIQQFEGNIEELMYLAQMTALAREHYITIHFNTHAHFVTVDSSVNGNKIERIAIPQGITVASGTHTLKVSFNRQGNIDQAGTLFISSKHYRYQFTFLLGQGRFYVEAK